MSTQVALWIAFHVFVVAMLVVDLGVARRRPQPVKTIEAVIWTCVWVALSLGICGVIGYFFGLRRAGEFLAGYTVEYALSVDNLFVFILIFSFFKVAPELQHRLLFWGILGEFALRAPLLIAGTAIVRSFHGVLYAFGAFLLWTAVKMAFTREEEEINPEHGWIVRLARRVFPVSKGEHGPRFLVREEGRLRATPLFLVLVVLNVTDLVFALDSIPAVLGVTRDPFVAYTSNVCAIFGLRSLFFVVASLMDQFRYLKAAVSVILGFIGAKMIVSWWYEVPIGISLVVIAACLAVAIVASVIWPGPAEDASRD